jgi:hypothetical protein
VLDIRFSRVLDLWLLFGLNPVLRSRPLSGCTVLLLPRPSGLLRPRPSGLSRAVTFSAFVFGLAERSRSGVGFGFACGEVSFFQSADLVPER